MSKPAAQSVSRVRCRKTRASQASETHRWPSRPRRGPGDIMIDPAAEQTQPSVLKVLEPDRIPANGLKLKADVVVIGSGASGAVVAFELTRAGAKVVVLEAGPHYPSSEFTEILTTTTEAIFANSGDQLNKTGDMSILQGTCVGGSTVVNGTVCFRTPNKVLESWRREHGLDNLSSEVLAPYFDRVERSLGVHVNEPHEVNKNGQLLIEGAKKLGIHAAPVARNVRHCALTGHCGAGCKTDRKQSMLVTYLPWASEHGATILSGTRAETIEVRNKRATAVRAIATDSQGEQKPVYVEAGTVVVAAGAVQTPLLFQKNELGNSSGLVGHNFACHPSVFVFGEHDQDVYGWVGALCSSYAGDVDNPLDSGYLLEAMMLGPQTANAASDAGVGAEVIEFSEKAKKYQSAITLIHDHNVGRVYWDGDRKQIDYDVDDRDFVSMQSAFKAAANVFFAAGAKRVFLPTNQRMTIESVKQVDATIDALRNEPQRYRLFSYHPQGTMRMGRDPKTSVVAPDGRCHDLDNVYVTDASLFPSSLLVNPQMTVYALSNYLADQMIDRG
ncbi:MAG: GMC family oxidoreductase [Myxococcales bacterium]|nr:MAG: GMC family oxidoreductase [Myxococcales bacterium]